VKPNSKHRVRLPGSAVGVAVAHAREDHAALRASADAQERTLQQGLQRLGSALERREKDVLRHTLERMGDTQLSGDLLRRFEQFNVRSTGSLARWLTGENRTVAREAGQDTWRFYGEMAARHEVSLCEITRRCLAWRDAVAETLHELASEHGVAPDALERARETLQLALEYSLVRIAKAIDAERERTDHELAFIATHDALTGLPNRARIVDRTEQLLTRARRHGTPVAALILDLDNFKSLCETLGRDNGEELLRAIAERLDGLVRDSDALGRIGEDEFVVIVEEHEPSDGPLALAERLREALGDPFHIAGASGRVSVSACIGIAIGARPSAEGLIRDAEIAMLHAKSQGRHGLAVFEPGMEQAVEDRRVLEVDLRDALANGELELAYQPIVAIADVSVIGMEALLRWRHPVRGVVSPAAFIPLLEKNELIVEVGAWVLHEACRFAAGCAAAGQPIQISVNVSGRQLDDELLVSQVREALDASGLDAHALTLEITETTLMRNVQDAALALASLRELGARIAIDDFGTGYSSLSHLQQLPIDELKIDRSFVSRLEGDSADATLVQTMIGLGKALSIHTVAEGIETSEQLAMLRAAECDHGQGFLLARPLDAAAAEAFLRSPNLAAYAQAPARVA
jgi:diguanylate cyclase (GGDEF)-like protein